MKRRRGWQTYLWLIPTFAVLAFLLESLLEVALCRDPEHRLMSFWEHCSVWLGRGVGMSCRQGWWGLLGVCLGAGVGAAKARFLNRRRAARAEMVARLENYEAACEVVNEGVFEWEYPSDRFFCSSALFRLCGYDRPASYIKLAEREELIHPEDRDYDLNCLSESVQNYANANYQIRLLHRDGHSIPVHVRGKVRSSDAFHQAFRIVGTIRNIALDNAARQESDQTNSRMLAAECSPDEVVGEFSYPDMRLRTLQSNQPSPQAQLLGSLLETVNLEQLLTGMDYAQLDFWLRHSEPNGVETVPFQMETLLGGDQIPVRLVFFKRLRGTKRLVIVRAVALAGEWSGSLSAMVWERGAEAARLSTVLVGENDRVLGYTPGVSALLPALKVNASMETVLPEADYERFRRVLGIVRRRGRVHFNCRFGDGTYRVQSAFLPVGRGCYFFDLRDRSVSLTALEEARDAYLHEHRTNRKRQELLNAINYELRKPLTGILGFADLLRDPALAGEERESYLQFIISCGNRLLEMWNGILQLLALEAGDIEVRLEEVNLNSVMNHISAEYASRMPAGVQLRVQKTSRDVDADIISDESILLQILNKLMDNAIKYTTQGWIEAGYMIESEYARFYVADSGCGIPPEMREDIFDPFRREQPIRRLNQDSVGLGLPIVKKLVELLDGSIGIHDTPGGGTRFRFSVPLHRKKKEEEGL